MVKKLVAVLTAAVLSVSMTAAVFAQGSVQITGVVTEVSSGVDANGNAIEATISEVPAEYQAAVNEIRNIETVKALLGDAFVEGMQVVDVKDVTVPEGTVFPATLTFTVTGVSADSNVAVLHYDTEAGAWEVVESKAGNGTITAVFNSLSPVAFVVDGGAAAAAGSASSSSNTSAGSSSSSSPKTGETSVLSTAGIVAVAALLGMGIVAVRGRKRA
ncbi:MAG: LPXTG cell wall anchor domain-containing protein [Ruminococcus sp.]